MTTDDVLVLLQILDAEDQRELDDTVQRLRSAAPFAGSWKASAQTAAEATAAIHDLHTRQAERERLRAAIVRARQSPGVWQRQRDAFQQQIAAAKGES